MVPSPSALHRLIDERFVQKRQEKEGTEKISIIHKSASTAQFSTRKLKTLAHPAKPNLFVPDHSSPPYGTSYHRTLTATTPYHTKHDHTSTYHTPAAAAHLKTAKLPTPYADTTGSSWFEDCPVSTVGRDQSKRGLDKSFPLSTKDFSRIRGK